MDQAQFDYTSTRIDTFNYRQYNVFAFIVSISLGV